MKNPKWKRDEIILALDLYFSPERGPIDKKNPKVIALSEQLRNLPLHSSKPDEVKFRNPNGVSTKLSNFLALDDTYHGVGLKGYSKLDEELFKIYSNNKEELKRVAGQIREVYSDSTLRGLIAKVEDEEEGNDGAKEGAILFKYHKTRERNQKLVRKKKKQALKEFGKLSCEACEFDFSVAYPELGDGFIECHHRTPLSEAVVERETKLSDLALVCSNCSSHYLI